jgi:hypothetical protein
MGERGGALPDLPELDSVADTGIEGAMINPSDQIGISAIMGGILLTDYTPW